MSRFAGKEQRAFRIAVVGGGVSAAAVLLRLAQRSASLPLEVELVEPRALLGAGLTYSAADPQHRVNAPSLRMSLDGEESDHFHRWYEAHGEHLADPDALVAGSYYPRRAAFGRYVDERLRALLGRTGPFRLRHWQTHAVSAARHGSGYRVQCADGRLLDADVLVLCTGNPPPVLPPVLTPLMGDERLVVDPWATGAVAGIGPHDRVLIVGTGLSMGDAVATLLARGHDAPILALSRHGLTPRPRPLTPRDPADLPATDGPTRVSALLRRVRIAVQEAEGRGRPWTDVLEAVRLQNGVLWTGLSLEEQQRFLRHLRPYWDVHRFQSAPQIDRLLARKLQDGGLCVAAASLTGAVAREDGLQISYRRRGADAVTVQRFDALINCTGAAHGSAMRRNPILASLLSAGVIRADPHGIGIAVNRDGRAGDGLWVVGPPTRGTLGEVVGISEIVPRAHTVADLLIAHAKAARATRGANTDAFRIEHTQAV